MPEFIPGLQLCEAFYAEVVRPILAAEFSALSYSAARIDSGSDVLGFDTEMSTDHGWGPRLQLFLREEDYPHIEKRLRATLSRRLPPLFRGYPTGYQVHAGGSLIPAACEAGAVTHFVEPMTVASFFRAALDFDIRAEIAPADWLTFPEQTLRTLTAGAVYHDGLDLQTVRDRFRYYPHDVWLYLLAAGWTRIGQEEHLMGRAGYVGDELGSALIASRLVRDLMRLCFLMERRYAPYPKWFGTAFRQLPCAATLEPLLRQVQRAETWQEREAALVPAYEAVAALHDALGVTPPLSARATSFHNRPFRVIALEGNFADALCGQIQNPEVRRIADRRRIGSIDQFSDSTDLLSTPCRRQTLRRLYE